MLLQMRRLNDRRFQIVHFSIQTNHLHLVVEAADRATITRKMAGFMVSFAKRLNAMLGGRRGKVWIDRYFRRDIERARDMNAVLRYVRQRKEARAHRGARGGARSVLDGVAVRWLEDDVAADDRRRALAAAEAAHATPQEGLDCVGVVATR